MIIQVVGAHQTETAASRATSLLVDGDIAVDTGSLASALTLQQQRALRAVLLSHHHFDHIAGLPSIGLHRLGHGTLPVHALQTTWDTLRRTVFNGEVWPDLETIESRGSPAAQHHPFVFGAPFQVGGVCVTALESHHTAPTAGFVFEHAGRRAFFTADTSRIAAEHWVAARPHLLLVETTLPNRHSSVAAAARHLTPESLKRELLAGRDAIGTLPAVRVVHVNIEFRDEIADEVARVAQELGADIRLASDGERLEV